MIKRAFLLKTKNGSIVTTLISLGILGISSAALVGYLHGTAKSTLTTTSQHNISYNIHYSVLNKIRSMLIETKIDQNGNTQDQNRWGICSLVKTPKKVHGIDSIEIDLSLAASNFSKSRWETFFNRIEYIPSSGSACRDLDRTFNADHFSRCFKYIGKAHETSNEIYVIARIIPEKFPNFSPAGNASLDAKLVIFRLQVIVGMHDGTHIIPFKYEAITWSNEIVECEIQVRDQWINVQFSGTGTGRLSKSLVVNHSFFNKQAECTELQFGEIPSEVIKTGKIVEGGTAIAADHRRNDKIACKKEMYRCPNHSDINTDFSNTIFFNIEAINNSGGNLDFNNFNFTLLNSSDKEIDYSANGQIDTLTVNIKSGDGTDSLGNTIIKPTVELTPGANHFKLILEDKSPGSLVNLCKRVCAGEEFYPAVSMDFDHPPGESHCVYSKSYTKNKHPEYRIGCKVCHSKICTKVGLGTFGPKDDVTDNYGVIQGLVDEPLDGTIPECKLPLKTETNKYKLPDISGGSGDCVAMAISSPGSFKNFIGNNYVFENCSSPLPVLCFAYGHYMPAITISTGSPPQIFKGNFQSAQKACYEMGKEIIEKGKLAGFFINRWESLPFSRNNIVAHLTGLGLPGTTSHFDYINNATRGLFLVPFYDIDKISKRLSERNDSANQDSFLTQALTNSKIWVAIERDEGKQIIGSIPRATVATSPWALFDRKKVFHAIQKKEDRAIPVILNNTNTISDSGTDTILVHNLQYKGAVNVSGGSYPVLCRKNYGDFVLAGSSSVKNAPAACKSKGAHFIPPVSSLEWVKAMTLINENDELYPFPYPGDLSGENTINKDISVPTSYLASLGVFVALSKKSGNNNSAKNYRLSLGHFPDKNGKESIFKFKEQTGELVDIPNPSQDYIGIIDEKGRPVVPSLRVTYFKNFPQSQYYKACYDDKRNEQVELKTSVTADKACPDKSIKNKSDINTKRKSIRFMSEWITQYDSSANFIIEQDKVDKVIERAENIWCTKVTCPNCKSACNSAATACNSACPTLSRTSTDQTCVRNCPPGDTCNCTTTTYYTDPDCLTNCTNQKVVCNNNCLSCGGTSYPNCQAKCDCEYDCSGHPWTDILSYP